MRAGVYHPAGVEKLHPVLLNGPGFCSKVMVSAALGTGAGVGVGADEPDPHAAIVVAAAISASRQPVRHATRAPERPEPALMAWRRRARGTLSPLARRCAASR